MSSTINASTASGGGVITTADASGILQLQTGGTTAVTIDASQNVGIGTSSPSSYGKFAVYSDGTTNSTMTLINPSAVNGASLTFIDVNNSAAIKSLPASGGGLGFFVNASTERMRIDSIGNLLVGTTVVGAAGGITMRPNLGGAGTYARITLNHSVVTSSDVFSFEYLGTQVGRINVGTTITSYVTTSDQRLKENIVDAPSALASIKAIQVRSFDWKSTGEHQEYGYIAQELLGVAPEVVSVPTNEDEMMGVDFGRLTPRLVKAIQEQQTLIEALTARLTALEAK